MTIEAIDKLRCIEREIARRKASAARLGVEERMPLNVVAIMEAIAEDYRQAI